MNRIKLFLANEYNERLLIEWVSVLQEVEVETGPRVCTSGTEDLLIADGPMLKKYMSEFTAMKKAAAPAFLPLLLVTSKPDVQMMTADIWQVADELILSPIEKNELMVRIEILLRSRELSQRLIAANQKLAKELEHRYRLESERSLRTAYSQAFSAVTGETLIICTPEEILESLGTPTTSEISFSAYSEAASIRQKLSKTFDENHIELDQSSKMISASGEALVNAIKHADGGSIRAYQLEDTIQVLVSDHGPGIDFDSLPKSTLVPGYSSKNSLGMGFSIMLELADRLHLSTGSGQTMALLEMDSAKAEAKQKSAS